MGFIHFLSRKPFRGWAAMRTCAALLALLAGAARLPVRGQALPTFTYAAPCGEGTVGFGGLRIAQTVQDAAGNSYVTGSFDDRATFGTFVLQSPGYNMFVVKIDPAGTVLWAVRVGRANGFGIAVDAGGNVFVTGGFTRTTAFGPFSLTSTSVNSPSAGNTFVAKLDPTGTFLWAVRAGGNSGSNGKGIVVDAAGNSYVCGSYTATFSTADFGPFRLTNNNNAPNIFVAKLSPAGTFLWATGGGGTQGDDAYGIALDANGNSYITGYVSGSFGVVAQFGTASVTVVGDEDIVVAKVSPSGVFQWAASGGGATPDVGQRIAVDAQGIVHIVGFFMSARPVFGAAITLSHSNQGTFNAFVATLTPAGTWQWVVQGGGPGDDYGYDLAVDAAGNTYAAGSCSYRADFGGTILTTAGDQDVMVSKISPTGAYLWAMQAGGTGNDKATSAWLRPNGSLTLAGSTLSSLAIFGNQGFTGNPAADTGFLASLAVGPLSVASARSVPALTLWPNPARSGEAVQVSGLLTRQPVEVRDVLGRLVLVGPMPVAGAVELRLPAGLGSGVYFVRSGQQVRRFVIQ